MFEENNQNKEKNNKKQLYKLGTDKILQDQKNQW